MDWIGPDNRANNGSWITEIWNPILEYPYKIFEDPENANLYNQKPEPLFYEVRETTELPTSTMLVMDMSKSMDEEIDSAKIAAKKYIDQLRPFDKAGKRP